jgi:homoserine O-acetyltransferase
MRGIQVAYETWGERAPDDANAVLVLHALTGDSHAAGPAGTGHPQRGWWSGVIGPGLAIDTNVWWVVCPNVLGGCQGTTGPSSDAPDGRPFGSRFPRIQIRDQIAVESALSDWLGVRRWRAVVGGSMGGMRALEWAVTYPDRVELAVVLASCAAASAEQIALCSMQIHAIRLDPAFAGGDYEDPGPVAGMGLARRVGQLSYRCEPEMTDRFARRPQDGEDPLAGGRYAVESYLDHAADKLAARFDANTYIVLSEAMNNHDVGRARGGIEQALARVTADVAVIGIDSDRLYPLYQQLAIAELLPGRPRVTVITSRHGHDGFLVESEQVGDTIRTALEGRR